MTETDPAGQHGITGNRPLGIAGRRDRPPALDPFTHLRDGISSAYVPTLSGPILERSEYPSKRPESTAASPRRSDAEASDSRVRLRAASQVKVDGTPDRIPYGPGWRVQNRWMFGQGKALQAASENFARALPVTPELVAAAEGVLAAIEAEIDEMQAQAARIAGMAQDEGAAMAGAARSGAERALSAERSRWKKIVDTLRGVPPRPIDPTGHAYFEGQEPN
ncbi:hypothetical protein [Nocardia cyriacigeorgica]|uniref:hypothetical protein n=1 Tax=Nocardia cyriacigeorgica TaxID=135487 RepID=UPI001319C970|nr:hypothetical protein [Nocardia cyriacigeorgica]